MNATKEPDDARQLIESVLEELAADAEALLVIAGALEDRAVDTSSHADPKRLEETASLVKAAALQMELAAANVVGSAERLRIIAEFARVDREDGGERPS